MSSNTDTIRAFMQCWSTLDADKLADFFTEDGSYHNIPAQPVSGRDNVRQFIAGFTSTWTETTWEIAHIAEHGDVVFCERLDRTKTSQGDVDLPCVGVFEMRDGKIHVWRDYFDLATYTGAMKPA